MMMSSSYAHDSVKVTPNCSGYLTVVKKMIMERKFQPVISFSFSRRECEQHAMSLSKLDFNTIEEKAILCLNKEDRNLPAIEEKALFATETFAMGLHMPAKTVVFTNVKKWDGDSNRYIGSGEYVQMSGRAGRRGKDERGICIIMIDEQLQKFRNELKNRSRVLKKLGHIDADGVVQLNRRAAFLIDTGDELLVTESMFNGTFNDLDHHQVVALASCFIPGDRSNEQIHLRTEHAKALQQLQQRARRIAEVQHECKLEINVDEYVESTARPYLMDVMYCWSKDSIEEPESIDMVSKVEELEHRLSSHPLHKVQVFVKSLTGKTITVELRGTDTVARLKVLIYEKLGISSQEQWLVYRWKQLIDANTLVDYQAHSQSTIHLCLKL